MAIFVRIKKVSKFAAPILRGNTVKLNTIR
jgi:hypothetical protein